MADEMNNTRLQFNFLISTKWHQIGDTYILSMGQVKNNETTQKYCMQRIYFAVMADMLKCLRDYFCNKLFSTLPI